MNFYELRTQAGLLNADVAKLFDTSLPTIRRWNIKNAPRLVNDRLRLMTGHDRHWSNVQIRQGHIITSTGYQVTKADIELFEYRNTLLNNIISLSEHQNRNIKKLLYHAKPSNDKIISNIYQNIVSSQP